MGAGCKSSIDEEDFYGAYDAQDFALENGPKMGMQAVPSLNLVYTDEEGYVTWRRPRRRSSRPSNCRARSSARCSAAARTSRSGSPSSPSWRCSARTPRRVLPLVYNLVQIKKTKT